MTLYDQYLTCQEFTRRVNRRAEEDLLEGNPIPGAHHRALLGELLYMERLLTIQNGQIQNAKEERVAWPVN